MDNKDKVNKEIAEYLLKEDRGAFIKDIDNNIYFCDIIFVGEETITIQCYGPKKRTGLKYTLNWILVETIRPDRRKE
jgi:hypothetical protein